MRCGMMALVLVAAGLVLPGQNVAGERLVVPPEIAREPGDPPRLLRGSAIPPRPLAADLPPPRHWAVAAGQRLWLVDPAGGEIVVCRLRATSTVGRRVIACVSGDLPAKVRAQAEIPLAWSSFPLPSPPPAGAAFSAVLARIDPEAA